MKYCYAVKKPHDKKNESSPQFFDKRADRSFFSKSDAPATKFFHKNTVQLKTKNESESLPRESPSSNPGIQKAEQKSLAQISDKFSQINNQNHLTPFFAGVATEKKAPGGIQFMNSKSSEPGLSITFGLTPIKGGDAFTPPEFDTIRSHKEDRSKGVRKVHHFATVKPTSTKDAVHESYYPGPGDHRVSATLIDGEKRYKHFIRVSRTMSELARKGEKEHLDDAKRAFDLTYGLIAKEINKIANKTFGPAKSPFEADKLAEKALAKSLPSVLKSRTKWGVVLIKMLKMTGLRDKNGWHTLSIGSTTKRGKKMFHDIKKGFAFRVGKVPSDKVVNYPAKP